MQNFDDFNPEIPQATGKIPLPEVSSDIPGKVKKRAARPKPDSVKKKKSETAQKKNGDIGLSGWLSEAKAWITSPTLRIISGFLFIFMAAFLVVAFFSMLKNGFADASSIDGVTLGTANVKNAAGEGGARISSFLVNDCFGIASLIIIFWMSMIGLKLLFGRNTMRFKTVNFTIKCMLGLISVSLIVGLLTIGLDSHFMWGGNHGYYINSWIINFLGWTGALMLCAFMLVVLVSVCLGDVVKWIVRKKQAHDRRVAHKRELIRLEEERERQRREMAEREQGDAVKAGDAIAPEEADIKEDTADVDLHEELSQAIFEEVDELDESVENNEEELSDNEAQTEESLPDKKDSNDDSQEEQNKMTVNVNHIGQVVDASDAPQVYDPREELPDYKFPPYALLKGGSANISVDQEEQHSNKGKIEQTLLDFGIPIKKISATVGPTVTLYEIVPEDGVKIAKIRGLVDDIAMRLNAIGVRIIAPIPLKGTVGIEVANKDPQVVSMRTILTSKKYQDSKAELPLAIGSTISNEVYLADLTKMPHLLVAGATGQGKSVGLNAIIVSLLYRKHPAELKFVMIDPKMVELSVYRSLEYHYLAKLPGEENPIITDMKKVVPVLSSLVIEMEDRYRLLMEAGGVRNIKEYNAKFLSGRLSKNSDHRFLPYIVLVVDEFADLMMTAGKEVEKPIIRLAQKARAIGIHMIIATQRPSTDVITGLIKANFPSRIAFKVSSGVDSKTILNSTAAQQLIGRGDMLISNNSALERVQCAFSDTPEVESICAFISQQPGERSAFILPDPPVSSDGDSEHLGVPFGDRDPLFNEVAETVVQSGFGSTSSIQRKYSIGYNRAGKIMDQLQNAGIVGPASGGKRRDVLVDMTQLQAILNDL